MSKNDQKTPLTLVSSPINPLTLAYDSFLITQEAARLSPNTLKWYRSILRAFFDFLREHTVYIDIYPLRCYSLCSC